MNKQNLYSTKYELPDRGDILALADRLSLADICDLACDIRNQGHGDIVTYSRKVFIPLTRLCRDFCHYCTFATAPKHLASA